MSEAKFLVILPQITQMFDKIQIRGEISNNAKEFSINFANETNEYPQSIAYHLKFDLANKMLIEDYKENNEWMNRIETSNNTFDGRLKDKANNDGLRDCYIDNNTTADITDTFPHSYSLLGPEFDLEFSFDHEGIYVYLVCGDGRNLVTSFLPKSEYDLIESVQIWGDVARVKHLSFTYF